MEIRPDRMVHLGYGKFWRSDHIVGLLPIEEDRGPGRRTEVYLATREEPVVASRTEESILEDMSAPSGDAAPSEELRAVVPELAHELRALSPVLKRMLRNEGSFDVAGWIERLESLARESSSPELQEELFP